MSEEKERGDEGGGKGCEERVRERAAVGTRGGGPGSGGKEWIPAPASRCWPDTQSTAYALVPGRRGTVGAAATHRAIGVSEGG